MKIGIIGSGNIGGNLSHRLTALGHQVAVANSRGPQSLTDLAAATGITPVELGEVSRDAEVVVVAIPMKEYPKLPADLFDGAAPGVVVIDTGNYYPVERDGRIDPIEAGQSESGWTEDQLGRQVVKAFNASYAADIVDRPLPAGHPDRMALSYAGDDEAAKARVGALIDALGFDPVDAGSIADSWRQHPGTPIYGSRVGVEGVRKLLAEAKREDTDAHRGLTA
jgi:predicted dinucleotide-binding enzyme